jgi:predicted acylesterase/phospholipase RssA
MRIIALIFALLLLAGCATTPPVASDANFCAFKQKALIIDDPDRRRSDADYDEEDRGPPGQTLILSGGSQNGAYGAGFLKEWGRLSPGGKLPHFDLVTGISTGAILATWAYIGEPDQIAEEYLIKNEKQLMNVYARPSRSGSIGLGAALTLIRKNSFADLEPLRMRLRVLFTHELLSKVANRQGRFKIAAVDVDDGQAISFDMRDMAKRATGFADGSPQFEHFRNCYADAVMASSSVPLGAKPVFIDNRMYIDGGARFGVFVEYLDRAVDAIRAARVKQSTVTLPDGAIKPAAPNLFILVNGTQWVKTQCGKIDSAKCKNPLDPDDFDNYSTGHKKWHIAELALHSNDILINQVYRFSVARVKAQYDQVYPVSDFEPHFYFSRMHRHDLFFPQNFSMDGKSCMTWQRLDKEASNPFEFYPSYMKCLQLYGAHQAEKKEWFKTGASSPYGAMAD